MSTDTLTSVIQALCGNLDEQVRVYERLLQLSSRQFEALRDQNPRGVHDVLPEIELTMLDRAQAEAERNRLLPLAAAALGVNVHDVTATRLAEAADDSQTGRDLAARLEDAARRLEIVVTELDSIVAVSSSLLNQELVLIDGMVQSMTQDRRTVPTYGKSGTQLDPARLRLLDAQV